MEFCEAIGGTGARDIRHSGGATGAWARLRRRLANAIELWRRPPALAFAAPLDERILRDIGVTRHGIRESALAARNEARLGLGESR